jgi:hypothetical protein
MAPVTTISDTSLGLPAAIVYCAFDREPRKDFACLRHVEERTKPGHIEARAAAGLDAETAPCHFAAKCQPLLVEEARRALHIRQRVRIGRRQPLELRFWRVAPVNFLAG